MALLLNSVALLIFVPACAAHGGYGQGGASGQSTPACADKNPSCSVWASRGECQTNRFWMLPNCQKSCDSCGTTVGSVPVNGGQSQANCADSRTLCAFWASKGECVKNRAWMHPNCQTSCGSCGTSQPSQPSQPPRALQILIPEVTSDGCFQRFPNMQYECAFPYDRHAGGTEEECLSRCVQDDLCKAVQYSSSNNFCDLFALAPSSGGQPSGGGNHHGGGGRGYGNGRPPPPPPRRPYHRGRRTKRHGSSGGGGGGRYGGGRGSSSNSGQSRGGGCYNSGPRMTACPGVNFYVPTGVCGGGGSTTEGTTDSPDTTVTTTTIAPTPPLPDEATCGAGEEARFLQVDGYELSGSDDITFDADFPEECMDACFLNALPDGSQAPCRSADYDFGTGQCSLTLDLADPVGNGQLVENPDSIYFEKICVDADVAQRCPGPFVRAPQMILIGFAETVVDAVDLNDCLQRCANAEAEFGFTCNSGMIFYTETTINCVLNSETAQTQPDLFTDLDDEPVDYFEMGCLQRTNAARLAISRDLPAAENEVLAQGDEWGPWTPCDERENVQHRFRRCPLGAPAGCDSESRACAAGAAAVKAPAPAVETAPQTAPLRTRPSLGDRESCNMRETCCPLLRPDGARDCSRGRRIVDSKRQPCIPTNCEN